jgi:lipopolysaccharide transport system permease protein
LRSPEQWQLVYALNPLVGIIEGLRWSLLNGMDGFPMRPVVISLTMTLIVVLVAIRHFLAVEGDLADLA